MVFYLIAIAFPLPDRREATNCHYEPPAPLRQAEIHEDVATGRNNALEVTCCLGRLQGCRSTLAGRENVAIHQDAIDFPCQQTQYSLTTQFNMNQYWLSEGKHKYVMLDEQLELFGKNLQTIEVKSSGVGTRAAPMPDSI